MLRAVRGATGSQIVGITYGRLLRIEGLEPRQMLSAVPFTGAYTQDFDTLVTTGTNTTWANDSTLDAWSLFRQPSPGTAIATIDAGSGSSNNGSFYSYGTGASTERALGGLGSGGTYFDSPATGAVAGWMAVALQNTTGVTINSLNVHYDGEQWRNSGDGAAQTMTMQYGFGTTFTGVTTWNNAGSAFEFTSPQPTGPAGALDGNAAPNRTANIGGTLTSLNWTAGSTLWVRWVETNESGSDHGLAIDNVVVAAGVPSTATLVYSPNPAAGPGHDYGRSVAVSGNYTVVGAYGNDFGATHSGIAFVYDSTSVTPTVPIATLNNPTPAPSDQFGWSVAVSGNYVVVGAYGDDTGAIDAGSAYVYDLSSMTPTVPIATLNNPTPAPSDLFGNSVAVSGNYVVVGAYLDDTVGPDTGSAYVYDLSSMTPTVPIATLNNPTPAPGDLFGNSVAVSGNYVVVGAYLDDTGAGDAGSAYVYDLSSMTPTVPIDTLNNPTPAGFDRFGNSVAVSGNYVVVGAYLDDTVGPDTGSAYVYDLSSMTPTVPIDTLNNPTPAPSDLFGYSVAVSGNYVVVGAYADDPGAGDAGSAYVYDLSSMTPTVPIDTLNNPTPAPSDYFGVSVAASGNRAAVGALGDLSHANFQGTVYTYLLNSPPSVADQAFFVAEDDDGSSSFATVVASDAEGPVTFAIIGGTGGGLFLIDANTGALTVDTTLDYETTTSYTLLVEATDAGGLTDTATITVNVSPVNDNDPIFTAGASQTLTIAENSANGTVVGSAAATDADLPGDTLSYSIVGGDPNNGFAIDSNGQLTIADASTLDLDFENGALVATLTVEVSDGTNTAQQTVTVNVSPVNDNDPIFTAGASQTLTIAENSANGTVVGSAAATDADLPGDTLSYSIVGGDPNNGFAIDGSGQITIVDAGVLDLDYENGALVATLTVEVTDGTTAVQQTVTVNVFDVPEQVVVDESAFAAAGGKISVKVVAGQLIVFATGDLTMTPLVQVHALSSVTDLVINGRDGANDDSLTLDFSGGNPIPAGGLAFDGGTGGMDSLVLLGASGFSAAYTPDGSTLGSGTIQVGSNNVEFSDLEPVDISGFTTVTIASPANSTNSLVLDAGFDYTTGTIPAIVVSGDTGLVGMEEAHLWDNTNLFVDTSATTGGANSIVVNSAIIANHDNVNITLKTNAQGEVTFNADLAADGGSLTLDTPSVNLNTDVVIAGKTTTAAVTTFYVDDAPTGQIQDAIDLATNGDTIHVLGGTYSESLVINKNVDIQGASDATVLVDAGSAFTGIDVQAGVTDASISGITLSNYFSTGIHESGATLAVSDSTLTGGLTGVWVDGGTLDMDNTVIGGVAVFGVQVGAGGLADIDTSEITGTASTAAGVIVSSGHADIDNSILTASNRGLLVNATGTAAVHGSSLGGNSIAAIVNGTATTVDASGNAWGINSETGVQAQTVGPVDFTPYLDSSTDTDAGARGFAGDLSYLHVTTLGQQTAGGRIQEGVNLVTSGGIVEVGDGTYDEAVLLNKTVDLKSTNLHGRRLPRLRVRSNRLSRSIQPAARLMASRSKSIKTARRRSRRWAFPRSVRRSMV